MFISSDAKNYSTHLTSEINTNQLLRLISDVLLLTHRNETTKHRRLKMTKLMNLQGMLFTEQEAKEYYGERFDSAILEVVQVDDDGEVI